MIIRVVGSMIWIQDLVEHLWKQAVWTWSLLNWKLVQSQWARTSVRTRWKTLLLKRNLALSVRASISNQHLAPNHKNTSIWTRTFLKTNKKHCILTKSLSKTNEMQCFWTRLKTNETYCFEPGPSSKIIQNNAFGMKPFSNCTEHADWNPQPEERA